MNGEEFFRCVEKIVGTENARQYANRIGDLDGVYMGTILGFEALAFYVYSTGVSWHDYINGSLWSGDAPPEILEFVDLGYFDDETCRLEPLQNPFGPKVLPMSPV
jgi:hypothetical protein